MTYCTTGPQKDANLFRQAQAGEEESLEELMRQHEGLVHHMVRQQWRGRLSYEEALHAGRIGLWRAILGFDPTRGTAFSTYACVAIARRVWRAVKGADREAKRPLRPLQVAPAPVMNEVDVGWQIHAMLYALVAQLPLQQRWVVSRYYGLDGWGGCTLAQLGQQLGCSRQAVHYHLQRALLRLRHPAFSAALRALLGRNRRGDYRAALRPVRRGR